MGINEKKYKEARRIILDYLKSQAELKGLSQYKIAELTGFKQNNISRMLSGQYSPSLDNLIRLAEAIEHQVVVVKEFDNRPVNDEHIHPKFMMVVDPENNELYILHRQFPSCLIHVKQEIPVQFIVQDLYDDMDNPADIFTMPFVEEAKKYFREYSENSLDKN